MGLQEQPRAVTTYVAFVVLRVNLQEKLTKETLEEALGEAGLDDKLGGAGPQESPRPG